MQARNLRLASTADVPAIETLLLESVRGLSAGDYSPAQVEGALQGAIGLDRQLIADRSYFVVETGAALVASGGWSWRATLFGGDAEASRDPAPLDPATDAARIRAFFVHPAHARTGLGSLLMRACEQAAQARGFTRLELMATLPGQRLYARHGFVAGEPVEYTLPDGGPITFVPMTKRLGGNAAG